MSVNCDLCSGELNFRGSMGIRITHAFLCPKCEKVYCLKCGKGSGKKKCPTCGLKKKKGYIKIGVPKKHPYKKDLPKDEQIKEADIHTLNVIWKGKKDSKKISIGVSNIAVGTEFGGQDQESLVLKCGGCGKSDRFKYVDQDQLIFECLKCGALNKPLKSKEHFLV